MIFPERRKALVYFAIAVLWLAGGVPFWAAQWRTIKEMPPLFRMGLDDKKIYSDGKIYILAKVAKKNLPGSGPLILINPASGPEGKFYAQKLRYYLSPRKIISFDPRAEPVPPETENADFVLSFNRAGIPHPEEVRLGKELGLIKIFDYHDTDSYIAIYRRAMPAKGPR